MLRPKILSKGLNHFIINFIRSLMKFYISNINVDQMFVSYLNDKGMYCRFSKEKAGFDILNGFLYLTTRQKVVRVVCLK